MNQNTKTKISILISLLIGICPLKAFSFCEEPPNISIDTISDGVVEVFVENPYYDSFSYYDTLSNNDFLGLLDSLYRVNQYSFLGQIMSARIHVDTIVADSNTRLWCEDYSFVVSQGESFTKWKSVIDVQVITGYSGEISTNSLKMEYFTEFNGYCQYQDMHTNIYQSLIGKEFLFFGNVLTEIKEAGPRPNNVCEVQTGFFVKNGRVVKDGFISQTNGLSVGPNWGLPGVSISVDTLLELFEGITGFGLNENVPIKYHSNTYLDRIKDKLIIRSENDKFLINGEKYQ